MQSTTHVLVAHDTDSTVSDDTLTTLAGAFIAGKRSPNTRDAYGDDLRMFFRWCRATGHDPIHDITRTHLEVWARHLEDLGLSPSTRARRIGTVRCWYGWMIDEELYHRRNPARKVAQPRVTVVRERPVLTKREMHVLLAAAEADHPSTWAMVALGFFNGLRIGEICTLNIDSTSQSGWNRTIRIVGKGDKHDEVFLHPHAAAAVDAAAGCQDGRPVTDSKGTPLLVSPTTGRRMHRKNATTALARLCREEGLTRITPHGLRRTAITIAFQERIPARDVQLFARHSKLETTIRYDQRLRAMEDHLSTALARAIA